MHQDSLLVVIWASWHLTEDQASFLRTNCRTQIHHFHHCGRSVADDDFEWFEMVKNDVNTSVRSVQVRKLYKSSFWRRRKRFHWRGLTLDGKLRRGFKLMLTWAHFQPIRGLRCYKTIDAWKIIWNLYFSNTLGKSCRYTWGDYYFCDKYYHNGYHYDFDYNN